MNKTPIIISFVTFSLRSHTENIKLNISNTPSAIGVTNEKRAIGAYTEIEHRGVEHE